MHEPFLAAAQRTPDAIAVREAGTALDGRQGGGRKVTYRQLEEASRQVALWLQRTVRAPAELRTQRLGFTDAGVLPRGSVAVEHY